MEEKTECPKCGRIERTKNGFHSGKQRQALQNQIETLSDIVGGRVLFPLSRGIAKTNRKKQNIEKIKRGVKNGKQKDMSKM